MLSGHGSMVGQSVQVELPDGLPDQVGQLAVVYSQVKKLAGSAVISS